MHEEIIEFDILQKYFKLHYLKKVSMLSLPGQLFDLIMPSMKKMKVVNIEWHQTNEKKVQQFYLSFQLANYSKCYSCDAIASNKKDKSDPLIEVHRGFFVRQFQNTFLFLQY